MFRFDISSMSEPSCRSMQLQHEYEAIKYPSMLMVRPSRSMPDRCFEEEQKGLKQLDFDGMENICDDVKMVKQTNPPSPARTASTQCSSTCSMNNSTMSMEYSRDSIEPQSSSSSSYPTDAIKVQFSPGKEEDQELQQPSTDNDKGSKGIRRSNSFSKILKSLRKNVSLVTSASFDSGLSKLSKRRRKKKRKSTFSSVDVDVRVVEGEGVEVITKYSEESSDSSSSYADSEDFSVPKIIRDTSTFATTSVTSRSNSIEIYEQDTEIRRLCNLMHQLINSEDEDDAKLGDFNSNLVRLEKNDNRHLREEESELGIEVFSISSVSAATESVGFSDIMMFVNNEHTVLEYSSDDLHLFD